MKGHRIVIISKIFLFCFAVIWCLGLFTPLWVPEVYPFSKLFYSHICHQNPIKTFYIFHKPLLVCARCTGIYVGALISSVLIFALRKSDINIKYLYLSSIPMLFDVVLCQIGITSYSKYTACLTGFIFGSVTFLYIWNGVAKLLDEKR